MRRASSARTTRGSKSTSVVGRDHSMAAPSSLCSQWSNATPADVQRRSGARTGHSGTQLPPPVAFGSRTGASRRRTLRGVAFGTRPGPADGSRPCRPGGDPADSGSRGGRHGRRSAGPPPTNANAPAPQRRFGPRARRSHAARRVPFPPTACSLPKAAGGPWPSRPSSRPGGRIVVKEGADPC